LLGVADVFVLLAVMFTFQPLKYNVIGGDTVYAVCALAMAYTLLNLCMPGIHNFRSSQINFSSKMYAVCVKWF